MLPPSATYLLTRRRALCGLAGLPLLTMESVQAEGFRFRTHRGQSLDLEQQIGQGQWLLLEFWGSFCGVCEQHQGEIVALYRRYRSQGLRVIGVAVDGVQSRPQVNAFIERHQIEHPILIDNGHGAARFYAAMMGERWRGATPTYLLFKPSGELIGQNYGVMRIEALLRFIEQNGGLPS